MENEYKNTKIKATVKLYCNADPTMAAVRSFEELAVQNGRHSIIKDAKKYAEELDLQLWLNFPNPVAVADGKEVEDRSNFAILKNNVVKPAKSPPTNLAYMNINPHMSIEPGPNVPDAF